MTLTVSVLAAFDIFNVMKIYLSVSLDYELIIKNLLLLKYNFTSKMAKMFIEQFKSTICTLYANLTAA